MGTQSVHTGNWGLLADLLGEHMASGVPVRVVKVFRWRGELHTYDCRLWMPPRTARHLLQARAIELINHEDDLPIRRYRCRIVRPVDHSTEVVSKVNGSSPEIHVCG